MARWKLTAKHYLEALQFGQPSEWQREEINVQSGRAFRKTYPVPMFIDPDDPHCINRHLGYCVIATEGSDQPGDLIVSNFKPTPDMEPLDEEARQLSEIERPHWINPIDGLSPTMGEDFANQLLAALQQQMNKTQVGSIGSNAEVSNLSALVAAQQKQIESLISALSGSGRRVEGKGEGISESMALALGMHPTPEDETIPLSKRQAAMQQRYNRDLNQKRNEGAAPSGGEEPAYDPANHVVDDLEPLPSNEDVEAVQRAAAGLTKTPIKASHPVRRI